MKKSIIHFLITCGIILPSCMSNTGNIMKVYKDSVNNQVIICEGKKPVLQYNYKKVFEKEAIDTNGVKKYNTSPGDTFKANPSIYAVPRSNYIHPLYGLNGELLTKDWSWDHPHHRGIYWAWPEVKFGTRMGDLHALQIVFARPTGKIKLNHGKAFAQIEAENIWLWEDSIPIVREVVVIRAYSADKNGRQIDIAIRLEAMKDSITLARRETTLYGGLNVRMQTPGNQKITTHSDSTNMSPQRAWSDLSGFFTSDNKPSGLMVFQYKQNPDYPGDWIQYPELSWCQPTFPAKGKRYPLIPGKPLVLRYRLMVHTGDLISDKVISGLWDKFNSDDSSLPDFSFPLIESVN
jgi:hypothetical protein